MRDHCIVGTGLITGRKLRVTEYMTLDRCKRWKPDAISSFYKDFVVESVDDPLSEIDGVRIAMPDESNTNWTVIKDCWKKPVVWYEGSKDSCIEFVLKKEKDKISKW
jgi:hypothetical protein